MNLDRAFDQFLSGTTDVAGTAHGSLGTVNARGWDFGEVAQGITNDYLLNGVLNAGNLFTATLTWFRDRATFGNTDFLDNSFDNLDLELWSTSGGSPLSLISESSSRYNNTEHFQFAIPTAGQYMLRVRWTEELFDTIGDTNIEQYGLAWAVAVPEPSTLLMVATLPTVICLSRRRNSARSS
jgi:hypothetical protein